MREFEETKVIVQRAISVTCNKCGKTQQPVSNRDNDWDAGMHKFGSIFGYDSKFYGQTWEWDLCSNCLDELVQTFLHRPSGYKEDTSENYYKK